MTPRADGLRQWLLARNPRVVPSALGVDTDIIEGRVLESIAVVELVLYLEELTGRTLLVEGLDPDSLRSIGAIVRTYFPGEA